MPLFDHTNYVLGTVGNEFTFRQRCQNQNFGVLFLTEKKFAVTVKYGRRRNIGNPVSVEKSNASQIELALLGQRL